MKIAFATGHYAPFVGGIESHVQQIARRLAAGGDEITVLTQTDDRSWRTEEVIDGVLVRRFPVPLPSRHFSVSPALWRELHRETLKVGRRPRSRLPQYCAALSYVCWRQAAGVHAALSRYGALSAA